MYVGLHFSILVLHVLCQQTRLRAGHVGVQQQELLMTTTDIYDI